MTKDKIIIDDVNVAECKRRIGKNSYCRYFKRPCADNNFNCIWKQHERLKAENERMKKWRENSIKTIKKLSSNLKNYISAFNNLCGEINLLKAENEKFKQTLEEIKDLNNKAAKTCRLLQRKSTRF